jgi:hypothetical protein
MTSRVTSVEEIRGALVDERVELLAQPIVDLRGNGALARRAQSACLPSPRPPRRRA